MVNGRASLVIYIGAWLCVLLCVVGYILLAYSEKRAPTELGIAMSASFGVVAGSHVKAPLARLNGGGKE